jgi:hypothetical protein
MVTIGSERILSSGGEPSLRRGPAGSGLLGVTIRNAAERLVAAFLGNILNNSQFFLIEDLGASLLGIILNDSWKKNLPRFPLLM